MSQIPVHFVIPCHRGSSTIASCIESILRQDYPQDLITISVVENGFIEGIESLVNNYPQTQYFFNPKKGRSEARNFLLSQINAPYVAFIDCDVFIENDWLSNALSEMQSPFCAAVSGSVLRTGQKRIDHFRRRMSEFSTNGSAQTLQNLNGMGSLNTAAVLIRTNILKDVKGFDTDFKRCEDFELTLKLRRKGYILASSSKMRATVSWDLGVIQYLFNRFFSCGLYTARAAASYGLSRPSLISFFNPKKMLLILKEEKSIFLLFWLIVNCNFNLGYAWGYVKFKKVKISSKGFTIPVTNFSGVRHLFNFNTDWEVTTFDGRIEIYNNIHKKFFTFHPEIKKIVNEIFLSGSYIAQTDSEDQLISKLIKDKFLIPETTSLSG